MTKAKFLNVHVFIMSVNLTTILIKSVIPPPQKNNLLRKWFLSLIHVLEENSTISQFFYVKTSFYAVKVSAVSNIYEYISAELRFDWITQKKESHVFQQH